MKSMKFMIRSGGPLEMIAMSRWKRMNMNNEPYELCLSFVHVYKIAFRSKKVLTKSWKILYTAFT